MNNKEMGSKAKDLVLFFYDKTELKYTNRDIMIAVRNAKNLLKDGYTYDEIKETIEYSINNPPPGGIYSFGFIQYNLNRVCAMKKASKSKTVDAIDKSKFKDYGLTPTSNKDKIKAREIKVDTSIFGER